MELLAVPRGAAAYRVSIPLTLSYQLHESIHQMASEINITAAQALITSFVALLHNQSNANCLELHLQLPTTAAETCITIPIGKNATFHSLATTVAKNVYGPLMFPIHIRFNYNGCDLELELQRFSERLQPYFGYNPREFERENMLVLINSYRKLLTRYATLPELPLAL